MEFLYAVFFGAGVAAFAYSKLGRRVGYGNTQNVTIFVLAIFAITTLFAFTIFKYILGGL